MSQKLDRRRAGDEESWLEGLRGELASMMEPHFLGAMFLLVLLFLLAGT